MEYQEPITNLYSSLNCLNPVPAFYDAIKTKNLKQISANTFILLTGMNLSWLLYGISIDSEILVSVCMKYSILCVIYASLAIYLKRETIKFVYLAALLVFEFLLLGLILPKQYLGLACTLAQVFADSSQLQGIIAAIKSSDSSYFNVTQTLISLPSSIMWTLIGLNHSDSFLIYPNAYNACINITQLTLALIVLKKPSTPTPVSDSKKTK